MVTTVDAIRAAEYLQSIDGVPTIHCDLCECDGDITNLYVLKTTVIEFQLERTPSGGFEFIPKVIRDGLGLEAYFHDTYDENGDWIGKCAGMNIS